MGKDGRKVNKSLNKYGVLVQFMARLPSQNGPKKVNASDCDGCDRQSVRLSH